MERKRPIIQVIICMVLLVFIWCGYYMASRVVIRKNDLKHLTADDFSFIFQIDSIEDNGKMTTLDGWAFKLGVDSTEDDLAVLV